ncbi:MAG: glucosamine-6-phosphate deaminase [Bacteroidota bacterium]
MLVIIKDSYDALGKEAAQIVVDRLRKKPDLVLGLATGSTPISLYKELIRMHIEEGLDFSKVVTFNLDEYVGLLPTHEQSYHHFMRKNLFDKLNIPDSNIHIPDGMADDIDAFCEWYEKRIEEMGGIDLQILGIGANGHIAFNEPGSSLGSRTRVKTLTEKTIKDNARFFRTFEEVPKYALTMGVGTIMDSRELVLVANGSVKAEAIRSAVEGPLTGQCPASVIQLHRKTFVIVDREASEKLRGSYPGTWKSSFTLER